jgi:predicted DNA-binding transcriptional regulator AlpA
MSENLFDQTQVSKLLGISPRTLERMRLAGTGPAFVKIGRLVRYRASNLEEFIAAKTVRSTSERSDSY